MFPQVIGSLQFRECCLQRRAQISDLALFQVVSLPLRNFTDIFAESSCHHSVWCWFLFPPPRWSCCTAVPPQLYGLSSSHLRLPLPRAVFCWFWVKCNATCDAATNMRSWLKLCSKHTSITLVFFSVLVVYFFFPPSQKCFDVVCCTVMRLIRLKVGLHSHWLVYRYNCLRLKKKEKKIPGKLIPSRVH